MFNSCMRKRNIRRWLTLMSIMAILVVLIIYGQTDSSSGRDKVEDTSLTNKDTKLPLYVINLSTVNSNLDIDKIIKGLKSDSKTEEISDVGKYFDLKLFERTTHHPDVSGNKHPNETQDHTQKSLRGFKHACTDSKGEATEPEDELFQTIKGSAAYVYSAFVTPQRTVRVLVLLNRSDESQTFSCLYRYRLTTSNKLVDLSPPVAGKPTLIQDGHRLPYTPAFLDCPLLAKGFKTSDLLVSVISKTCKDRPSNLLPVQMSQGPISREFTVCISPLHSNFTKAARLLEMIEFNKILGAEQIYVYNESCSPSVSKVLIYYKREGLVNVLQWHLPRDQKKSNAFINIHYRGQNAALNDCLYRNRNHSKYIVVTDIDEFIVPHNPNISNWSELIKSRVALHPRKTNFVVQMSHYRAEWTNQENKFPLLEEAKKYKSVVLQNIEKENYTFAHRIRSKYIADTSLIDEAGIHYTHRQPLEWADYVPASEAIVHHYRKRYGRNQPTVRILDEVVVRKYGEPLVRALREARKNIGLI